VQETIPVETAKQPQKRDWRESGAQTPFPFDITFRHGSGSPASKQYIRDTALNLHPFTGHVLNGKIIVDQSDPMDHKKHRYIVTLVLSTPGKPIVVKHNTDRGSTNENLYLAINVVFGKASHRLKHLIEKRKEHRKHNVKQPQFQDVDEQDYNTLSDSDTFA
jgi:ribosome-associated translation inhibitor RaiA